MASPDSPQQYVLGSHAPELARLDAQAQSIEPATRLLLGAAGLRPGWRVLDLGTGLGHVARLAATMVGPGGSVVGVDRSAEMVAEASRRSAGGGGAPTRFVEGDVATWRASEPFDAVVGRLVLFHVTDPAAVVAHHLGHLRPGGLFVAIDFDLGSSRSDPPVALVTQCLDWVTRAFRAVGAAPTIGSRLGVILDAAGLDEVETFGVQPYRRPGDPAATRLLAGVVRSLAGAITAHGIASADEIGADTLERRLADAVTKADAVILLPAVAGAWGRRRAG
jgi:SAM-dependent methyltransferase